MNLRIITQPTAEPVTVEDAMAHCRVDGYSESPVSADQTYVETLVTVARQMAENYTQRKIAQATYELRLNDFAAIIKLPAPVQSVESIKYIDADDVEQTVDADVYVFDDHPDEPAIYQVDSWPVAKDEPGAVRIRFVAGYTTESPNNNPLPKPLYQAMLMTVAHLYENRQDVADKQGYEIPLTSRYLMDPYCLGIGL